MTVNNPTRRRMEVLKQLTAKLQVERSFLQKRMEAYDKEYVSLWKQEVRKLIKRSKKAPTRDLNDLLNNVLWPGNNTPEEWLKEAIRELKELGET